MIKKYYTLRFERNDAFNKSSIKIQNANNLLRIGQTESCDVRLENNSQYEDAVFAVIEKRTDDNGWKLIRISPYKEHEVRVNGTPINYVHFLSDGDRIAFEGQRQELVFNIREDERYNSSNIEPVGKTNRLKIVWAAIISILVVCIGLQQLNTPSMTDDMIERAKESVFQIQVDTMKLMKYRGNDTIMLCYYCPKDKEKDSEFGQAFLTTDGMLVTARHCIEPWLNVDKDLVLDTLSPGIPTPVKLALKAVTQNIVAEAQGDSTRWQLVSCCSLRKTNEADTVILNVKSSAFIIDDTRDNIMELGDFSHQYFWRSISVRPRRIDMMLGDLAYIPKIDIPDHKGTIRLASKEDLRRICRKPKRSINILGRTRNDIGKKKTESQEVQLYGMLDDSDFTADGYPNIVFSIPHPGTIKAGFSGGPILIRQGLFKWCAIGLVSVKDNHDNNRLYSVPITEIERMEQNRINNDE